MFPPSNKTKQTQTTSSSPINRPKQNKNTKDPDVTHVEDRIDPVGDLEIIHAELRAKDVERLQGA